MCDGILVVMCGVPRDETHMMLVQKIFISLAWMQWSKLGVDRKRERLKIASLIPLIRWWLETIGM